MRERRMQIEPKVERNDPRHRAAERARPACLDQHRREQHGKERSVGCERPRGKRARRDETRTPGAIDNRKRPEPATRRGITEKERRDHREQQRERGQRRRTMCLNRPADRHDTRQQAGNRTAKRGVKTQKAWIGTEQTGQ